MIPIRIYSFKINDIRYMGETWRVSHVCMEDAVLTACEIMDVIPAQILDIADISDIPHSAPVYVLPPDTPESTEAFNYHETLK